MCAYEWLHNYLPQRLKSTFFEIFFFPPFEFFSKNVDCTFFRMCSPLMIFMMLCLIFVYIFSNNNQLFVYSHIKIIQKLIKKPIYLKTITIIRDICIQITTAAWYV